MNHARAILPEDRDTENPAQYGTALVLPVCFALLAWFLRGQAGPFWQWNLLDPAYFYLLDSLNLLNGDPPGHVYHPGVTVQIFGALMIKLCGLFQGGDVVAHALAEPERYLTWISNSYIVLNGAALFGLGVVARRVLGAWLPTLVCQLAPFMSTIVVKHAFLPKPETMLVFAVCLLIALALATFRDDPPAASRDRLAVGFGIVAGFIIATKITAAPVLVMPLFLLRSWRGAAIYAGVAVVAFALFFAPAFGAWEVFADWIGRVAMGVGPHGDGAQQVILIDRYPSDFLKILKRPSLKVPLILSVLALGASWFARRRGRPVAAGEVWMVIGVGAAQLAQTALVAKQPTAFYMIPSYMLGALSALFAIRLLWAARPVRLSLPVEPGAIGAVAFAVFVAAQTAGMERLSAELSVLRADARRVDNDAFAGCARIYIYAASAPVYAFYLANYVTGSRFGEALRPRFSAGDFWIDDWWAWQPVRLKDWRGPRNFAEVRASYPCVYFRGNRPGGIRRFLAAQSGGAEGFDFSCRAGHEQIAVSGVDCQGRRR